MYTYDIVDIDFWERDAILVLREPHTESRFYFQWPALKEPTLEDALTYIRNTYKRA